MTSFEEELERNGTLVFTNKGRSMMPLLRQGKDLFTVRKKGAERCNVGDVVLYRRPPDKYVLHRIIEFLSDNDGFFRTCNLSLTVFPINDFIIKFSFYNQVFT